MVSFSAKTMLTENVRIAFRGLAANKLRAALTMLGILIGVAAVITLLSIGDGVTRYVADQFSGCLLYTSDAADE